MSSLLGREAGVSPDLRTKVFFVIHVCWIYENLLFLFGETSLLQQVVIIYTKFERNRKLAEKGSYQKLITPHAKSSNGSECCRILTKARKFDHITQIGDFKVLLMTYKIVNGLFCFSQAAKLCESPWWRGGRVAQVLPIWRHLKLLYILLDPHSSNMFYNLHVSVILSSEFVHIVTFCWSVLYTHLLHICLICDIKLYK